MGGTEKRWLGLRSRVKPIVLAGILLGLGLGGFFDGIVLHQILQWHHMVSSHADPNIAGDLEFNVMMDGLFHVATYIFTVAGIIFLWRAWQTPVVPKSGRTLFGAAILGWGVFNLVEGIVNHHLLAIHHVWPDGPGPVFAWDVGFLIWGLAFIVGGYAIIRGDEMGAGPGQERAMAAQRVAEGEESGR